ncbi:diguanylate cyclase [Desertibacillus haloalkaliphilus]|uniref:diguanylate cyclase n=1 Tax=Desertibacillus haloalkaliphilus TaxID=1328930 RepID=UPI001C27C7C4|nr:diguanylate cyclase [Desertibacillus haloalkaliphilus]MBU8905453.1 diguanylate cyclase [Desertibacillus haloalkaliphilus]
MKKEISNETKEQVFKLNARNRLDDLLKVAKSLRPVDSNVEQMILKEVSELKSEAKILGLTEFTHIASLVEKMGDANEMIPFYMKRLVVIALEELLEQVRHTHDIQKRLPKVHDQTLIEALREDHRQGGPKSMLIVDSDLLFLNRVAAILSEAGFMVEKANNGTDALRKVLDKSFDCLVINYEIYDTNGADFLSDLSEVMTHSLLPIVIIYNDEVIQTQVDSKKILADDTFVKQIELDPLLLSVQRIIARNERMKQQVYIDELTGAYTRRFFLEQLESLYKQENSKQEESTIAIIDLDFFKRVNDTYGHTVGDEVLKTFARFMQSHVREQDVFARYGGEEFILLFPGIDSKTAEKQLNQLREIFSKQKIAVSDDVDITQTFSCGIVEIKNEQLEVMTPTELLNDADIALYEAKKAGRNQVLVYHEGMQAKNHKYKILIADDDKLMRTKLFKQLAKGNWELLLATNGEEALSIAVSEQPQLILLDGWMPKLDGFQALQKLREDVQFKDTAIIMLTGNDSYEDIAQALNMGADDYVTKPFSIIELEARMNRLLIRKDLR